MRRTRILWILVGASMMALFGAGCGLPTQADGREESTMLDASYSIEGMPVSRLEFEVFLKSLREIEGTWFCAETSEGGITGYDARDWRFARYEYRSESRRDGSVISIRKKR